jgi:carbamoyl-phosphate synthase large subunit
MTPEMNDVTVLVTGVGGAAVGNQVLKALRLSEKKYRVVAADASQENLKLAQTELAYVLPAASDPRYLDGIVRICQLEQVQVVVPGSEPELKLLIRFREHFRGLGILLLTNDPQVIDLCTDKMATYGFLKNHGFPAPRSVLVEEAADITKPADFPLIVKPARDSGGSRNVFIAQEEDELLFFARYLLRNTDAVLIQEYVGTPEEEYSVGVLSGLDGELLGSIVLRRFLCDALSTRLTVPNRTGRNDLGSKLVVSSGFSHGTIQDFSAVRKKCEEIAAALGSRGPLNVQCRVVDGALIPFEFNPRFSGSTSIRALAGFNEPDLLIRREFLGEKCQRPQFKKAVILRSLTENWIGTPDGRIAEELEHNYVGGQSRPNSKVSALTSEVGEEAKR